MPVYAGTDAGGGIAHGRIADEVDRAARRRAPRRVSARPAGPPGSGWAGRVWSPGPRGPGRLPRGPAPGPGGAARTDLVLLAVARPQRAEGCASRFEPAARTVDRVHWRPQVCAVHRRSVPSSWSRAHRVRPTGRAPGTVDIGFPVTGTDGGGARARGAAPVVQPASPWVSPPAARLARDASPLGHERIRTGNIATPGPGSRLGTAGPGPAEEEGGFEWGWAVPARTAIRRTPPRSPASTDPAARSRPGAPGRGSAARCGRPSDGRPAYGLRAGGPRSTGFVPPVPCHPVTRPRYSPRVTGHRPRARCRSTVSPPVRLRGKGRRWKGQTIGAAPPLGLRPARMPPRLALTGAPAPGPRAYAPLGAGRLPARRGGVPAGFVAAGGADRRAAVASAALAVMLGCPRARGRRWPLLITRVRGNGPRTTSAWSGRGTTSGSASRSASAGWC